MPVSPHRQHCRTSHWQLSGFIRAAFALAVSSIQSKGVSAFAFTRSSKLLVCDQHQKRIVLEAFDSESAATLFSSRRGNYLINPCLCRKMTVDAKHGSDEKSDFHDAPIEGFRLGYTSDVEGHWDYFLDYVQRSNVLDWEEDVPAMQRYEQYRMSQNANDADANISLLKDIKFQKLVLRPNSHFIFGGDSVDKGPGDIRLCRALSSLKRRYPDRVHLLVGNRDLNKLRLWSELSDQDMERPLDEIDKPFWNRDALSLKEHLEELREKELGDGEEIDSDLDRWNTKAERLRYMLKHTLGCPDTFEHRRDEIKILRMVFGSNPSVDLLKESIPMVDPELSLESADIVVTDEEVVESFQYEINHPDGSLRQYLQCASIVAIVGNTIFVHGAIDSLTMKYVPSMQSKFELPRSSPTNDENGLIVENVHEWAEALNDFLQHGLKDFELRPNWNGERNSRGGEALLAIQNRPAMWGRSVVCNSYGDGGVIATKSAEEERKDALRRVEEHLDPLAFEGIASNVMDPVPARWLLEHGIQRIVVGHKPTGDCPAVLSSMYTGVEVVSADTSYAFRKDLTFSKSHRKMEEELSENFNDVNKFGPHRGDAIAMVEIAGPDAWNNWLECSGALACGTEYLNRFPLLGNRNAHSYGQSDDDKFGDMYLGRKLSDGWWVKAAVPPNYHLCRGAGRSIEYDIRLIKDVVKEMLEIS